MKALVSWMNFRFSTGSQNHKNEDHDTTMILNLNLHMNHSIRERENLCNPQASLAQAEYVQTFLAITNAHRINCTLLRAEEFFFYLTYIAEHMTVCMYVCTECRLVCQTWIWLHWINKQSILRRQNWHRSEAMCSQLGGALREYQIMTDTQSQFCYKYIFLL